MHLLLRLRSIEGTDGVAQLRLGGVYQKIKKLYNQYLLIINTSINSLQTS